MTKTQAKAVLHEQRVADRWRFLAVVCVAAAVPSAFVSQAQHLWAFPFVLGLAGLFSYLASIRCQMDLVIRPMLDEAEQTLRPEASVAPFAGDVGKTT